MSDPLTNRDEIIRNLSGRTVVKAGAGTGKTTLLVRRYLAAVEELLRHLSPREAVTKVLAVTFTRMAAREMKQRVIKIFEEKKWDTLLLGRMLCISTIDSFCSEILRENAVLLGLDPDFKILEAAAARLLFFKGTAALLDQDETPLPDICESEDLDRITRGAFSFIQKLKSDGITPEDFALNAESSENRFIAFCYANYERMLLEKRALDFSGLLLATFTAVQKHPSLRQKLQNQYLHILVDEYQDTSPLQSRLLNLLARPQENYFVVGDENQSIYSFRNVDPQNLKNEESTARVFSLAENFRSSEAILSLVNSVFQSRFKNYDPLLPFAGAPDHLPELILSPDYETEADAIAEEIETLVRSGACRLDETAILLRALRTHVGVYEEALRRRGIPYLTSSGTGFYERPEIQDVLSLLRFVSHPHDDLALFRLLTSPFLKLTVSSIQELVKTGKGESLYSRMGRNAPPFLSGAIELYRKLQKKERLAVTVIILLKKSGIFVNLKSLPESERIRAEANLRKFMKLVTQFESTNIFSTLEDFHLYLKEIREQEVIESEESLKGAGCVTLSTIHQAKGLEYPVVFVANVNKQNFPSRKGRSGLFLKDEETKNIEEEKRLFYVAMTRARERLYLLGLREKKSEFLDWFLEGDDLRPEFRGKISLRLARKSESPQKFSVSRRKKPDPGLRKILTEEKRRPETVIMKQLTITQLAAFSHCPSFYKFRYVFKLPDGAAEALPADGEKETEAVLVGNAVHLVLERFAYGEKKTDRMLRTAAEYLSAQGLAENEIEADYLPAVKPMLENFLSSPLAGRRALGVEVPFSLILEDVEIKGTIDRIETDHTLVDYKTGSFSMKESHELALNVYALGAEKILKLSPEKLVLFFLSSNEMRSVKKWPSGETEEKVRGAVRKIKSGEFESAGEKECSRCFYREACRIAASKREEPR